MDTTTTTTTTLLPTSLDHTLSSPPSQQYLKMEDLHTSSSPSPSLSAYDHPPHSQEVMVVGPTQVIVQSKPAKKRKSWGQALPEPKTTLPPRKRAKTEDEKEQRRIERIKRNRAAAHNSRERKRQETERYAVALAKAEAELAAYRSLHGPLPANIVLPEVTLCTDEFDDDGSDPRLQIKRKTSSTPMPPPLSLVRSHGTPEVVSSPASTADTTNLNSIKQEPIETSFPSTLPPALPTADVKAQNPLDLTQHSAAMLCDLQCQSSGASTTSTSAPSFNPSWWATLFLFLMTQQLQSTFKTLLMAIWTLSPSRMVRLMQASAARLTSRSTISSVTPYLLRSMAEARLRAQPGSSTSQQGALAALSRTSREELARMRATAVAKGLHLLYRQRKALGRNGRKRYDVRKDDENGGV
ncbi:basic region leucin zipper [Teratosphaeria destructans]|uniref:Basic region leucin zipper n=1 Tax=Teratosphaeria destructans TaxID=418781 RepID=A0A9W7W5J7_9PEZI|nr:basic region leucin zipper [Teratosphaeria destructans]